MSTPPAGDFVYLREQIKIEPLVCRWYAWSHLISPLQRALNLAYRHLPALRSFVANPRVHAASVKDPRMFAGPYLHLGEEHLVSARELIRDICQRGSPMLHVADEIIKFDRQLQSCAKGSTLDPLYELVPEALRGCLELTYNLNSKPSFRLFEAMLADDELNYDGTSEIGFINITDEERKYFLNTPRLDSRYLIVRAPFHHELFDELSQARIRPVSFDGLTAHLELCAADRHRLRSCFTTVPPRRREPSYGGPSIRVRYFGHACVLVQTSDTSILIDPLVSWDQRAGDDDHLTFYDLPDRLDYVFISHNHQDHFQPEVLLQLRDRIGKILVPRNNPGSLADPSMKQALARLGHPSVVVVEPQDAIHIPDGTITSIPFCGEHADLDVHSKHGLHLQIRGRKFLFLADSDCKDPRLYGRLTSRLGRADTLFIGMECEGAPLSWLYQPYLSAAVSRGDDESRRLSGSDCKKAWSVVRECGCQEVFVYAMGQEPWLKYMIGLQYQSDSRQITESDALVSRCREAGLRAKRLFGCETMLY